MNMEDNENISIDLMLAEHVRRGGVRRLQDEAGCDFCRMRRRTRWINSAIVCVATVVMALMVLQPSPDGFYASNQSHRITTLNNIDQTLVASL